MANHPITEGLTSEALPTETLASEISAPEILALGGFPIIRSDNSTMIEILKARMEQRQTALFFANTNFVVKCQSLKEAMKKSDTLIVNDGIGLDIATWLVHRKTFIENLNGTDFTPRFLRSLKDARVFLFGGKPGIAQRAADALMRDSHIQVVGVRNGYEDAKDSAKLIADINQSGANVVLVAMGNPHQEQWIIDHRAQLTAAKVLMGVGALLDFLAGDKSRAPALVQRLRLEWLYRLCLEPSRLLKRYTIDIAVFLRLCLRQGKSLG